MTDLEIVNTIRYALHYGDPPPLDLIIEAERRGLDYTADTGTFQHIFNNMSQDAYYTAPSDEVFHTVKAEAIRQWKTYDDTYGYATEKIKQILPLQNVRDNAWSIIAMFDHNNQAKLYEALPQQVIDQIREHAE